MASTSSNSGPEDFRPQVQRAMDGAQEDRSLGGPSNVVWYTAHGTLDSSLEPMLDDEAFAAVDQ